MCFPCYWGPFQLPSTLSWCSLTGNDSPLYEFRTSYIILGSFSLNRVTNCPKFCSLKHFAFMMSSWSWVLSAFSLHLLRISQGQSQEVGRVGLLFGCWGSFCILLGCFPTSVLHGRGAEVPFLMAFSWGCSQLGLFSAGSQSCCCLSCAFCFQPRRALCFERLLWLDQTHLEFLY